MTDAVTAPRVIWQYIPDAGLLGALHRVPEPLTNGLSMFLESRLFAGTTGDAWRRLRGLHLQLVIVALHHRACAHCTAGIGPGSRYAHTVLRGVFI